MHSANGSEGESDSEQEQGSVLKRLK